jgi:hypothetical protein
MITGHTPFGGGTSSVTLERHLTESAVPPSLRRPDRFVPIALERAVMRALEKQATARHPSADAFAAALAVATPRIEPAFETAIVDDIGPFSTEATTLDVSYRHVQRLPCVDERTRHMRAVLEDAFARGASDDIIVAALDLARALVDEHALLAAITALEQAIDALTGGNGCAVASPRQLWRLLLTLAALYQGLGNPGRARRAAMTALDHAVRNRCDTGMVRASSLLSRLR